MPSVSFIPLMNFSDSDKPDVKKSVSDSNKGRKKNKSKLEYTYNEPTQNLFFSEFKPKQSKSREKLDTREDTG